MIEEEVTARNDGVVTSHDVENHNLNASNGGGIGLLVSLLILAAVGLGVFYLMNIPNREAEQAEAIQGTGQLATQTFNVAEPLDNTMVAMDSVIADGIKNPAAAETDDRAVTVTRGMAEADADMMGADTKALPPNE